MSGPAAPRRRRRWPLALAAVLAVAGTAGVVVFTGVVARPATARSTAPAPAVVAVTRSDLVDRIKVDGTVGHGEAVPLTGRRPGTVTALPQPGAVVDRGQSLYSVDEVGVPVLFGTTPMYRELAEGAKPGADVKMVQENLLALGYRETGSPDGVFGAGTTRALKRWQRARGVEQTGRLGPGDVVVVEGPVRVEGVTARLGAAAEGDLMTVSGTARLVSAELEEAQRRYAAPGAVVRVVPPDGRVLTGRVRDVGTRTVEGKPKLVAAVVPDDPAALPDVDRVTVTLDGERRAGVLAVPVRALVALREGGYAVEAVEPRRFVPVTLGLFADGLVEVSGPGVTEGLTVVTTS
ncbi:peptidoglycan-binding protein [Actinokineospora sp. PR83]|uniref:peptidoglycan-binding protein n=1 Tax=Actinokineospora sp. PR83 TaxID=2884908 RepID=UPI0027E201D9|nr:peptidoglycan-binding protein [Actinokineospora sp. PR83]MCG8914305.1 peptidoglycan-binding protein [Actinokineospora sp. PR83]